MVHGLIWEYVLGRNPCNEINQNNAISVILTCFKRPIYFYSLGGNPKHSTHLEKTVCYSRNLKRLYCIAENSFAKNYFLAYYISRICQYGGRCHDPLDSQTITRRHWFVVLIHFRKYLSMAQKTFTHLLFHWVARDYGIIGSIVFAPSRVKIGHQAKQPIFVKKLLMATPSIYKRLLFKAVKVRNKTTLA